VGWGPKGKGPSAALVAQRIRKTLEVHSKQTEVIGLVSCRRTLWCNAVVGERKKKILGKRNPIRPIKKREIGSTKKKKKEEMVGHGRSVRQRLGIAQEKKRGGL